MDKKRFFNIQFFGIFVLLAAFTFVFFSINLNAGIEKENFVIGDNVKINLENVGEFRLKIQTPSETIVKKGENEIVIFKPKENGKYEVFVDYKDKQESYSFFVRESVKQDEEIQEEIISDENEEIIQEEDIDYWQEESEKRVIRINEPVRWVERIYVNETNGTIDLPDADNVSIYRIEEEGKEKIFERAERSFGALSAGEEESVDLKIEQGEFEIEYYTAPPTAEEMEISERVKEVKVSSPEGLHYENVLSYAEIPEFAEKKNQIKIYWKEEDSYLEFEAFDRDGDNLIDYVEWIVPHLSEQTFQIIIIVKAEHLNGNREVIEDIFESVKELDAIWSPTINNGEYVRVVFERRLTNVNDITVFPRVVSGNPRIEIYELDSEEVIAEFSELRENEYNKVYLTELLGEQDSFDLRVINGEVEFDHIIDPASNYLVSADAEPVATGTGTGSFTGGKNIVRMDNNRLIAYWEDDSNDPTCAVSTTDGATWASASSLTGTAEDMAITTNGSGIVYLALGTSGAGDLSFKYNSTTTACDVAGGTAFADVSAASNNNRRPDVAFNTANNSFVACTADITSFDLEISRTNIGTTLSWSTVAVGGDRIIDSCSVDADSSGNVYVAVDDSNTTGAGLYVFSSSNLFTSSTTVNAYSTTVNDVHISVRGSGILVTAVDTNSDLVVLNSSSGASYTSNVLAGTYSEAEGCIDSLGVYHLAVSDGSDIDYIQVRNGVFGDFFTIADTANVLRWPSVRCANAPTNNRMNDGELELVYTEQTTTNVNFANFTIPTNFTVFGNPQVTFVLPAALGNYTGTARFNFTLNEEGLCNYTLNGGAFNFTMTSNLTGSGFNATNVSIADGTYTVRAYCVDIAGNTNLTSDRNFTMDSTPPNLTIVHPLSGANYSYTNVSLNFTARDNIVGLSSCWYTNDSGLNNYSLANCANITYVALQGETTLRVFANDTLNNLNNSQNVTFFVDSIFPLINYTGITASDQTNFSRNWIYVNVSVNETNEINITFSLFNSTSQVNVTTFSPGNRTINWTSLPNEVYTYNVTVADRANNRNTTATRTIRLDTTPPSVTIVHPIEGVNYSTTNRNLNFSVFDNLIGVYSCWYTINAGATNTSIANCANTTFIAPQGNVTLRLYSNDSLNNINDTQNVTFFVDSIFPVVNFTDPTPANGTTAVGFNWIYVNVSVNETNEINITFSLFNSTHGSVNITTFTDGRRTINWTSLDPGLFYYNVTVVDRANNRNSTETRTRTLPDLDPPTITIVYPPVNGYYYNSSSTFFNVSLDQNASRAWYQINTSLTNFTMSSLNNIHWNATNTSIADGNYRIVVYANDSFNNIGVNSRNFSVDTTKPLVSFGIGTENDGVNVSRNWSYVNVSVIELNEANITFTLYNTTSQVNVTTFSAGVRTMNWTNLPDENYFYNVTVVDLANNLNTTLSWRIRLDTRSPGVNLTVPTNYSFSNTRIQNFTVNGTDNLGLSNLTLRIYNSTNDLVNLTTTSNFGVHYLLGIQVVLPYDDNFTWGYEVRDSANNLNLTENRTLLVDATNPGLNFTSPTESNGTQLEQTFIFVNVSITESNFANITFELFNNSGATLVNSTTYTGLINEINWTNLSNANVTYFYNVSVRDFTNNFNGTETRQIKLYDATAPSLNLIEPQNRTYFTNESLDLIFDVSDLNLQSCWYGLNGGANVTIPGCVSTTFNTTEGSNRLFLYANDSLGLLSVRNVTFVANSSLLVRRGGILAYGYSTLQTPYYRFWNGTGFIGNVTANSVGGTIQFVGVANSPSRDEQIIITADAGADINVQINGTLPGTSSVCWHNGTTCSSVLELTAASTAINRQKMDVAYETLGDDALIVWSDNDATPQYMIWNGTSWSVNLTIPQSLMNGGVVSHLKLVSHPFREEIALIMTNTSALNILIWNGSEWGCEPASLPNTALTGDVYQMADSAYEQVSGDLFVASSINGAGSISRATKPDGSCVYTTATETSPTSESEIITVGARYGSDHVGISIYDIGGTEGAQGLIWNGTVLISTSTQDADSYPEASPYLLVGYGWAGRSPYGLTLYSDAAASLIIDYDRFNISSGTWSGVADAAGLTAFSDEEIGINAFSYIDENKTLIIVKDDLDDLWAKGYNGDTNSFFQPDNGVSLTNVLASANFPSYDFEFDYDRYGPQIFVNSPNNVYLNASDVGLNITLGEGATICNYQLDEGFLTQMTAINTKNYYTSLTSVSEGQHNVTFICEDVWENERNVSKEFIVDLTFPEVSFTSPTESNGTQVERDWIFVNVSVNEANEANITFTLFNLTALVNQTTLGRGNRTINWTNLAGTFYYYNVTVVDLVNFRNSTETRTLNLTRIPPIVNLLYPNYSQNFSGFTVSQFNFSVSDNNTLINCSLWGNWTGIWHLNQTITNPTRDVQLNFSAVNTMTDGIYKWNVYCYDLFGVYGANATNFTFSTFLPPDAPRLFNISQSNNQGTGNVTLFWNVSNHSSSYRIYYNSNLSGTFTLLNTTSNLNYTDTSFGGNVRRFYLISAVNPQGENYSAQYFGAHVYTLRHNGNTRNWIAFPTNALYLTNANATLDEIRNSTAFTMWNETLQIRTTCNKFSCPTPPSCTPTTCNFNFTLQQGRGYEVNINSSAPLALNWSLVGIVYNVTTINLNKNTTSFGKNWIGLWGNTSRTHASQILQNISSSDAVSRWDSAAQTSRGIIPSPFPFGPPYIGTNFSLMIEEGYEVSVANQTNWTQN